MADPIYEEDPGPEGYEGPEDPNLATDPDPNDPDLGTDPDPADPADPDPADPADPETPVDPDPEPQAAATRKQSAEARIRRQQAELARTRAETAALRAQIEQVNARAAAAQQAEQQRRNAEMLANLPEDERQKFLTEQRFRDLQAQVQRQGMDLQENADRTAFQAKAAADPLMKRYEARVEQRLLEERAQGRNIPRENIYKFLIGEDIATKGPKAVLAQRAAASRRVANATGAAPRTRSDVSPSRARDNDSIEAIEARLSKAQL